MEVREWGTQMQMKWKNKTEEGPSNMIVQIPQLSAFMSKNKSKNKVLSNTGIQTDLIWKYEM